MHRQNKIFLPIDDLCDYTRHERFFNATFDMSFQINNRPLNLYIISYCYRETHALVFFMVTFIRKKPRRF